MSLKDALDKLSGVDQSVAMPATPAPSPEPQPANPAVAKTAPGAMMKFLSSQSDQSGRVKELEAKLQQFDGALPVRRLDGARIRQSRFANRHEDHYRSAAYQQLVEDISAAGRNVQPIRVRPVAGDPQHDFEIVYGHRRLRACQQLGIPIEAVVAEDSDAALFEAMCRENFGRVDLSAYEEGLSYKRALESGIYPTQHKMAAAIGVTQAHISQVMTVASLPAEILAAFSSPLEIQYRWAEAIQQRLKADRKGMLQRAAAASVDPQRFTSAKLVFEYLMEKSRDASMDVLVGGKKRGVIRSRHGVVSVSFSKHAVDASRIPELQALLAEFLRVAPRR
jgi:ParB family chromosome partitioning protein